MATDNRQPVGLMGGSFNPVHAGHLMVASYMAQFTPLSAVWMLLSPQNPLKEANPAPAVTDVDRLRMLITATAQTPGIEVCDIELSMPKPSYTIDTLNLLERRYPRKRFRLIIGSDNWRLFRQWRNHQEIIDRFGVLVYPRPGYRLDPIYEDNVEIIHAPQCELSSTFIRDSIARGKNMASFLPAGVWDYIQARNLYRKTTPATAQPRT